MLSKLFIFLFFITLFLACRTTQLQSNLDSSSSIPREVTNKDSQWIDKENVYHPEEDRPFDLHHTKLDIRFDWKKQYLHGIATLKMSPYQYPQNRVVLDAKGFDIHQVLHLKSHQQLEFSYDGFHLAISLEENYTKSDTLDILVKYTAKPNELPKGGSSAITDDRGLYFINPDGREKNKPRQVWTQGEIQSSSCWFPTFDSPNMKTTQEIFITTDTSFITLSNGKRIESKNNGDGTRTDHWKQEKPHAPYLFMMAVGKFSIVKDKWQNKPVYYYVEPAYEKYAKSIFGNTPEMMTFFSDLLQYPYPWVKYHQIVVRDYVSGAMENTSASLFMEELQADNRSLIDRNWDDFIAHELFHQWFGDLVTCESWANLPLNESFATYAEYLWFEHKYGKNVAEIKRQKEIESYLYEAQVKQKDLIRYNYTSKEAMFDNHSYAKGSTILHLLRNYVGDEAFLNRLTYI